MLVRFDISVRQHRRVDRVRIRQWIEVERCAGHDAVTRHSDDTLADVLHRIGGALGDDYVASLQLRQSGRYAIRNEHIIRRQRGFHRRSNAHNKIADVLEGAMRNATILDNVPANTERFRKEFKHLFETTIDKVLEYMNTLRHVLRYEFRSS